MKICYTFLLPESLQKQFNKPYVLPEKKKKKKKKNEAKNTQKTSSPMGNDRSPGTSTKTYV